MKIITIRRRGVAMVTVLLVFAYIIFLGVIHLELTAERFDLGRERNIKIRRKKQGDMVNVTENVSGNGESTLLSRFQITNRSVINTKSKAVIGISDIHMDFAKVLQDHYIYSAYIDTRDNKPNIRIIALVNTRRPTIGWCYFKSAIDNSFSDVKLSSKLTFYQTCEGHSLTHVAYILSCEVPPSVLPITHSMGTVVVTEKKLVKTSQLRNVTKVSLINTNLAIKRDNSFSGDRTFAICIPPLFGDISVYKLIEFIELTRLLGAKHFVFYNYDITRRIENVLRYYEKMGVVSVLAWKLPVKRDVWYSGQSVAIGDCLLRTMYHFDWVSFNDVDEFIISQNVNEITWNMLIESLETNNKCEVTSDKVATYSFKSAYFNIPLRKLTNTTINWLITQETTNRTVTFSKVLTKQLVKPERVFEKGIHHLSKQFLEEYSNCLVDETVAYLHHYATCKSQWGISCGKYVPGEAALRYKHHLQTRVKDVLSKVINIS